VLDRTNEYRTERDLKYLSLALEHVRPLGGVFDGDDRIASHLMSL